MSALSFYPSSSWHVRHQVGALSYSLVILPSQQGNNSCSTPHWYFVSRLGPTALHGLCFCSLATSKQAKLVLLCAVQHAPFCTQDGQFAPTQTHRQLTHFVASAGKDVPLYHVRHWCRLLSAICLRAHRVTVSSYPEDVKITISHLVTIMGGKYTTSMGKRNSHLLIRAAAGPKFAGCASRGVIPVTADWLIESAHAGEKANSCVPILAVWVCLPAHPAAQG